MYMHDAFKMLSSFLSVISLPISTEKFPPYPFTHRKELRTKLAAWCESEDRNAANM